MADEVTEITTTKRTTAKKAIPKFETKKKKTFKLDAFDKVWTLKQPNQVLTSEFIESDSVGQLIAYITAHVVKSERDAFTVALRDDEDFGLESAMELSAKLAEIVYADIPTNPSSDSSPTS